MQSSRGRGTVGFPRGGGVKGRPSDATGLQRQMMASAVSGELVSKRCVGQTPAPGRSSNSGQKNEGAGGLRGGVFTRTMALGRFKHIFCSQGTREGEDVHFSKCRLSSRGHTLPAVVVSGRSAVFK